MLPIEAGSARKTVVISYSSRDVAHAEALEAVLVAQGHQVFRDKAGSGAAAGAAGLRPGQHIADALPRALRSASAVVVIWSEASALSDWVKHEASYAAIEGKLACVHLPPFRPASLAGVFTGYHSEPLPDTLARPGNLVGRIAEVADPRRRLPARLVHDHIKPTPNFTGRDAALFDIDNALWRDHGTTIAAITQAAVVNGLGGVGKSSLAREYATRAQDGYAGVWWLNAANGETKGVWDGVEQGLVALGERLLPGLADLPNRAEAARATLHLLETGGFTKPWLIVFDNVDDPRVLEDWRPPGNVHVIATSRIANWGGEGVLPIEVRSWDRAQAVTYLAKASGRTDLTAAGLDALASALGGLPLALAHAAAYLKRRQTVTAQAYIADLDRRMADAPKDSEYPTPVYATFRAAIVQAEREAPGASAVLFLSAFLDPVDIPEALFRQDATLYPAPLDGLARDHGRLADALGLLDDLSLVEFDIASRSFGVHRLVQAAARDALADERERWARAAVVVLRASLPKPARETLHRCVQVARHAVALAPHAPAEAATHELAVAIGVTGDVTAQYGRLADGLALYGAMHALCTRLAKADPGNAGWQRDLSVSYNKVGDVLVVQGNLPEALKSFRDSLAIRDRLAKADPGNSGWQRDLSVSYDRVGDVLVAQGNLPEALTSFRDSLAIADRLAKADPGNSGWQRDLSVSYIKVGDVLVAQGNLPEALKSFRDSLAIADRLAKADPGNSGWQRDLSVSYDRVGDVLVAQGNLPEALTSFRDSLAIADRLAKADPGNSGWQRDLSVSLERIGDIEKRNGNLVGARASFERALGIYRELTARNPEDLPSRVNSVVPLWRLSDLDREHRKQHLKAALDILKPLASEGRLDAERAKWISQLEAALQAN